MSSMGDAFRYISPSFSGVLNVASVAASVPFKTLCSVVLAQVGH